MNRSAIPVILIGVTLLLLVSTADKRLEVHAANATDFSYAGSEIENAYVAIYQAENNHGNISQLINQLNNATQLLNKARAENSSNPSQATSDLIHANAIAEQVKNESALVSYQGLTLYKREIYESIGVSAVVVAAAILIHHWGGVVGRRLWLIIFRNYTVVPAKSIRKRSRRESFLTWKSAKLIGNLVLVVIPVILILANIQTVLSPFGTGWQAYSELGLLGPNQSISDYPTKVAVNQTFILYGYLENHETTVQFYTVVVKLGNQSTEISNSTYATAPVIAEYSHILDHNQSYIFPMSLSINKTGKNLRIIFELWSYNLSSSQSASFDYTGLWDQIWINVTDY
jgi:hypothetical protein